MRDSTSPKHMTALHTPLGLLDSGRKGRIHSMFWLLLGNTVKMRNAFIPSSLCRGSVSGSVKGIWAYLSSGSIPADNATDLSLTLVISAEILGAGRSLLRVRYCR